MHPTLPPSLSAPLALAAARLIMAIASLGGRALTWAVLTCQPPREPRPVPTPRPVAPGVLASETCCGGQLWAVRESDGSVDVLVCPRCRTGRDAPEAMPLGMRTVPRDRLETERGRYLAEQQRRRDSDADEHGRPS